MKLLLLGTGGYHPSDRRHRMPDVAGGGAWCSMRAPGHCSRGADHIATPTLDIFLSHGTHLDHVIGLTFLFDVLWQRSRLSG